MLANGWEFFILNPFDKEIKQTTQDKYLDMYNNAYNKLINQLCIPDPNDLLIGENETSFMYYVSCSGTDDVIELDEPYDYVFRKSVFIDKKFRKIRHEIISYYKMHDININNMYKHEENFYIILQKINREI